MAGTRRRRPPRPGALNDLPPLKIIRQIVLLQSIYYISALLLILFTALVAGKRFNLDLLFSWRSIRGDTTVGWMLGVVWLLNGGVGVIAMLVLVARSKLVPDFALSLHVVHLFIVSFYSHSPPRNWLWWGLQCVSAAVMTSLGVWCCRWRELSPITFGASATTRGQTNKGEDLAPGESPMPDSLTVCDEEQELGYGRGKGRGRRDRSAGAYEMVGLKAGTATDE